MPSHSTVDLPRSGNRLHRRTQPTGQSFPVDDDHVNQVAPPQSFRSSTRAAATVSIPPAMGKVSTVGHRARTRPSPDSPGPAVRPVSAATLLDPSRPKPAVGVLGLAQLAQAARTGRRSRTSGSFTGRQEAASASVLLAEAGPSANH